MKGGILFLITKVIEKINHIHDQKKKNLSIPYIYLKVGCKWQSMLCKHVLSETNKASMECVHLVESKC